MMPKIGQILHYRLSADDVKSHKGKKSEAGNAPQEGDVVPLIVTRAFEIEGGDGRKVAAVNGQAFLDNGHTALVGTRCKGEDDGCWAWPD